jgi:hypothetical protein
MQLQVPWVASVDICRAGQLGLIPPALQQYNPATSSALPLASA